MEIGIWILFVICDLVLVIFSFDVGRSMFDVHLSKTLNLEPDPQRNKAAAIHIASGKVDFFVLFDILYEIAGLPAVVFMDRRD